jgi:hypothetical protein
VKSIPLWHPYMEWSFPCEEDVDNPFDIVADAVFRHIPSGDEIKTSLFYDENKVWKLRFAGTKPGQWSFTTRSLLKDLDGLQGEIIVDNTPGDKGRGFVTSRNNCWAWSGSGDVFIPQLVMYHHPGTLFKTPEIIDHDIQTFIIGHGFTGYHIPVSCRWLDVNHDSYDDIESSDPNPDKRTFEALEQVIQKVYEAGGMVHLWMWGDNDTNHHMTPMKEGWGGKNGRVDLRLQRYLAARLGPLPGWTMGYGFDLEHWVSQEDVQAWYQNMKALLGWPHLLGGRAGSPARDGQLKQIWDGLDYAGYTHFRPTYSDYMAVMEANPNKPVMSEDRFRIRMPSPYPDKDYDLDMTRRGLWHSSMAGGVANIWGFIQQGSRGGASDPYPNQQQIKTYADFWKNRFASDLGVNLQISDNFGLVDQANRRVILYGEDVSRIQIFQLPFRESQNTKTMAVDTKIAYREIDIERTSYGVQLPNESDWAIVLQYE